jgi:lipopolysaccharide export system permease protein|tara:strand:+ start:276 stop:1418 length:1143 start_codon:yes stop_codon:yes gene_type:complete
MEKIVFKKILLDSFIFFIIVSLTISLIIWVLQAVNYLDFVTEDGHGFLIYIKYTLLTFPKIVSKIFTITLFFSLCYIILRYEYNNELIIFWNIGINKLKFVNIFIKFTFLLTLLHLLLSILIVPTFQDSARSHIRKSDIDLFETLLKPKKFVDAVNNLTIYYDKKNDEGELINFFVRNNNIKEGYKITIAKRAIFETRNKKKILVLLDGVTLNNINGKISQFEFSKSDFIIDRSNSKTTGQTKTQENSTIELLNCAIALNKVIKKEKNEMRTYGFNNCRIKNLKIIYQELYSRIILPFYNVLLAMVSLLLILKSKNDLTFSRYKYNIFIGGFIFIIFTESSTKFLGKNIFENNIIFSLPFVLFLLVYIYFIKKLTVKNKI